MQYWIETSSISDISYVSASVLEDNYFLGYSVQGKSDSISIMPENTNNDQQ